MKHYSDEELIGRVWDQENIRNLIGRLLFNLIFCRK